MFKNRVLCLCFQVGISSNQFMNGDSHGDVPSYLQDSWPTAQVVLSKAAVCRKSALTFTPQLLVSLVGLGCVNHVHNPCLVRFNIKRKKDDNVAMLKYDLKD